MHKLSESNHRGTGCGKAARPGLWGSGEATNRSTRTRILTQKRMINNFAAKEQILKGEFFWRLKYLKLRAFRNPVHEIALTAKHKRLSPILFRVRREHVYETFNFLAVLFYQTITHFQWGRGFISSRGIAKNSFLSKSGSCGIFYLNN